MKFNAHNNTPKVKTSKSIKIMLAIGLGLLFALFLLVAIVCSLYISSVMPAVLLLTLVFILIMLFLITQSDMEKAYVEITDNTIIVVDYYFGIQKKKTFIMQDIAYADILTGYSMHVRGYRYSNAGCTYIVFTDHRGKYLFKIICVPETKLFFDKYIRQN